MLQEGESEKEWGDLRIKRHNTHTLHTITCCMLHVLYDVLSGF